VRYERTLQLDAIPYIMKDWFLPTLAAILCWSGWAFLPKFSLQYISERSAVVYQVLGGAIVAFFILFKLGDRGLETHPTSAIIAVIAGMLNLLGVLFYLKAISKGSVAIVSTLSALYPLVVIVLAVVLFQEKLTLQQAMGIGFALVSIILITT